MKHPVVNLLRVASVAAISQSVHAESVSQPTDFTASNEGSLYEAYGSETLVSPGYFTTTVLPFDSSLGTLVSFTVHCEMSGDLSGVASDLDELGSTSGSFGGAFSIGGLSFDGTGGANGGEAAAGDPLEVNFAIPVYDRTLQASDAGVTYDPRILDFVKGTEPYSVAFSSGVIIDFSNVEALAASVVGEIIMTYNFETAAGGMAELKVVGILRNGTTGEVSIEWQSEPEGSYAVEAGSGLATEDWEVIASSLPGSGGETTTFSEMVPLTITRRFYRIREED